ncbi:MAG: DUF2852 domain-containing protein [Pseudomonadota bacterium]
MSQSALIRPAWTPATIALMVLGFVIFWPLGLAMLAYILWGDRLDDFKKDINRATDTVSEKFNASYHRNAPRSGNVAFDEWREVELARLEEERRELDESIREFEEYQRELRRAKDKEEFDAFMNGRKRKPAPRSSKAKGKGSAT